MYVRCSDCHKTTRVPLDLAGPTVTCDTCGRRHDLSRADELGGTPTERFRSAQSFSHSHAIDLASAYSVLLGVMSLDEATEFDRAASVPNERDERDERDELPRSSPAAASGPGHPDRPPVYDRAFAKAVAGGYLTIRMAVERGDRVTFASKVAHRHGLPMSLAFEVADNVITVAQAIERHAGARERAAVAAPGRRASAFPRWVAVLVGGGALAALAIGIVARTNDRAGATPPGSVRQNAAPAAPELASLTSIRSDADGRLTQLIGPSPQWVLNAYCTAEPVAERREPIRVEAQNDQWLGVYEQAGAVRAIRIRSAGSTGSWMAGDGLQPIASVPRPG